MSNTNSTRVFDVLACWPPGPPDPLKRHSSSSGGITQLRVTRKGWPGTARAYAACLRVNA